VQDWRDGKLFQSLSRWFDLEQNGASDGSDLTIANYTRLAKGQNYLEQNAASAGGDLTITQALRLLSTCV
jgi:hypothetical protein